MRVLLFATKSVVLRLTEGRSTAHGVCASASMRAHSLSRIISCLLLGDATPSVMSAASARPKRADALQRATLKHSWLRAIRPSVRASAVPCTPAPSTHITLGLYREVGAKCAPIARFLATDSRSTHHRARIGSRQARSQRSCAVPRFLGSTALRSRHGTRRTERPAIIIESSTPQGRQNGHWCSAEMPAAASARARHVGSFD